MAPGTPAAQLSAASCTVSRCAPMAFSRCVGEAQASPELRLQPGERLTGRGPPVLQAQTGSYRSRGDPPDTWAVWSSGWSPENHLGEQQHLMSAAMAGR